MFELFRRLFQQRSEAAFRTRVFRTLPELFPGKEFSLGTDPDIIHIAGAACSVRNLQARMANLKLKSNEEREMIREHFSAAIKAVSEITDGSWEDVQSRVKLQIGRIEILGVQALAHLPLGANLIKLMVVDGESSFRYITAEDTMRWKISLEELDLVATSNLNDACEGKTQLQYIPGPDRVIAVQTLDGFDAARILIPDFRAFVASKLGAPFLFGVPNRDFLICWSHDNSESFFKLTAERLRVDYKQIPYAISPEVFEGSRSGVEPWTP